MLIPRPIPRPDLVMAKVWRAQVWFAKTFSSSILIHGKLIFSPIITARLYQRIHSEFLNANKSIEFKPVSTVPVKEIVRIKQADGTLLIEGRLKEEIIPSGKVLESREGACSLCSLNMDVKYTDLLVIKQFLRNDGTLLPRRITGLCARQQVQMAKLVHKAHNAGLLRGCRPPLPDGRERKPEHLRRYKFAGLNRYFTDKY